MRLYTAGDVATLSGDLIDDSAVKKWWREAPPPDVVGWLPVPGGPQTLREYLQQRPLPDGVSLAPAGTRQWQGRGMRAWVRAWALGLRGQQNPGTMRLYTARDVATLSGEMISDRSVSGWWRKAAPQAPLPPPDVVGWLPVPGGPQTLREYLQQRGLPDGVSLIRASKGLGPGLAAWVRAWALGLQGQQNPGTMRPYTARDVVGLSGGLIDATTVRGWWREAAPQAPPPPDVAP
jgi:hypothetical protein